MPRLTRRSALATPICAYCWKPRRNKRGRRNHPFCRTCYDLLPPSIQSGLSRQFQQALRHLEASGAGRTSPVTPPRGYFGNYTLQPGDVLRRRGTQSAALRGPLKLV